MSEKKENRRVVIVGLGLIGGSIGLRLKAADLPGLEIVGSDSDGSNERAAKKSGAIDRNEHLTEAVRDSQLVILAVPISALRDVFTAIAPHLAEGAIVTDTASTKGEVMKWAAELLPDTVSFVGGHPMAGKEQTGIDHADAALFEGRAYCICPTVDSSPTAIQSVVGLAQALGAEPVFIDAEEHDVYAAAISHLPLITATALFSLMHESPSWNDLGQLASTGFRDMTRLASSDPSMSNAIWKTNREAIIHWIDRFSEELSRIRGMLSDAQDEELFKLFAEVKLQRDEFIANPPRRVSAARGPEVDRQRAFLDIFVGGMMADNIRRVSKIPELMEARNEEPGGEKRRLSLGEKMEKGIRADLEKMEREREEKAKQEGDR
ncbi:MAG: prephenate dehydrogenase/arogenate dehydrogenase family protein [Chloroflexi bacterium]|nr:prephenate dehydrogenase/arogenate dehydrogenase family protein [Chloroflexota bacterium]MCI0782852.1 prephenate dehydrogenase/arogenate dehydrogenase family protein [Chloroflexota bacterium]MCI0814621.1 prephenate dehydrogenase/arogenate dehydrogenase family protein [Chloroflexota bacterium]MCI0817761.1 prephenate dehydrogenase/arogenate dehydrogenase family protein [Chloroflexota bacterium]MCI0819251.1 prephenate dehydrogenase/arogenate dehydrogenase family protein [Chloroflexota bacterium